MTDTGPLAGSDAAISLCEIVHRLGLDTVEGAFAYGAGSDLDKPGLAHRRRTRLEMLDDQGRPHVVFLKRYGPEPLLRRLVRRICAGQGSPAQTEFENIHLVRQAGVATMEEIAFGQQGGLLGARRSFIVVLAVPGEALERCFQSYYDRHGDDKATMAQFTLALADLVRKLHQAGCVHRDLYASHVFLDESAGKPSLWLIDLARVFRPRWRMFRWRVKDLAALYYSMPQAWVEGHGSSFLEEYLSPPERAGAAKWRRAIEKKVRRMRKRAARKR